MQTIMFTMVPGFEKIVVDEINSTLTTAKVVEVLRGKVLINGCFSLNELCQLRCVDNIYYYIAKINVGPHKKDLEKFEQDIAKISFQKAIEFLNLSKKPIIIVSASKKGKQTYSRFDLSDKATMAISKNNGYKIGDSLEHNLAIRFDLNNTECMISVQLTKADFKFRGSAYEFQPGGIRPTIANALVKLSMPTAEDVFYDPFCGSGTISRERAFYDAKRILASDINPKVIESARINVPSKVKIFCCDARRLKVQDNSIDVIVSNIPWGKQIEVENVYELYISFLKEAKRVLSSKGRMVLLTDREEIVDAAEEVGFKIEKLMTISLHGLLPNVYRIME
ncbi:RNA methyltransferase [Lachnospiraceae bacterium MD1]|uniref:RNA methyltransferase n=1 Tax=Variimorphobacter saccharofermentans TaxID=2755051 RepID=A0A839K4E2_9FIRM|nr:methyltransferase domain-containing protein [Variimorphobacter saccharofermentans]MBB2183541.1 RNA methyltransferase [Variimorphobacter saccharofermentans]